MANSIGPLHDPDLELRAHTAGVNFATQVLLHLHDNLHRRITGYSPDWEAIAQSLDVDIPGDNQQIIMVNRRGREIAASFMRETLEWSRKTGSAGPEPMAPPES
jgi:hypothetical protein